MSLKLLLKTGLGKLTWPLTGSLRFKLIAWFFVPTAIILVAVALVNFNSYQNVTEDLVIERDRDLTQLWAGQLASNLDRFPKVLSDVSHTLRISKQSDAGVQESLAGASPQLRIFDGGVIVLDTFGTVTAIHPLRPDIVGQDWSGRAHSLQMLRSPGPVFSDVIYDDSIEAEVIEIAVPIIGDQGEFLGSMVGVFHLRATIISAFYSGIVRLRIGNGGSYIVDGNGKVLFHDNRDLLGADFGTLQPVIQVLLGEVGAIRNRDQQGTDQVSAFAPIPGTPWGLVTEESWSSLTSGSRNTQRYLLLLLALGVIVPAIVVAIGLKRVMRPVEELKRAAKEVARGNFSQTIIVHSGDEIEELATEFNLMAEQLRGSYEQLEQRVIERTAELASSELRYRDLFEECRDAIFITTPEGGFTDVNRAALELFGCTREEIIDSEVGSNWFDPQDRENYLKELDVTGSVSNYEMKVLRRDGTVLDCEVSAILRQGDSGSGTRIQGIVRDVTESKRAEAAALEQAREVAVLEERNRMAREIHDTMAQGFTSIVLQMEAAEQSMETSPGALPEHLNLARELAREGLQEARRSVLGLMPHALERATLDTALQEEVARFEAEGRSKIAFTQSGKRRELPPDVQTVLLRICQESLTNIRRHAEASQVDVTLDYQEHEVLLCVQDNGAGFDPPSVEKEKRGVSFGLTGMRQRAEQINGQLIVESAQNQGTLVRLSIPTP